MSNHDLSSPLAIAAAAKEVEAERLKLHEEGYQTGKYDTHKSAFLYAYGQALQDCAKQLEEYQGLVDIVLNYLGDHHDSSELYEMLHDGMELTNEEISFLGFDLPQLNEEHDISDYNGSTFVIVNGIEVDLSNYLTDKALIQKFMKDEAFKSDVSSQFEKAFSMADDEVSGDEVLDDVVESTIRMRLIFYNDYHQPQWFDTLDDKIKSASARIAESFHEPVFSIMEISSGAYLTEENNGKFSLGEEHNRLLFFDETEANNTLLMLNDTTHMCFTLLDETKNMQKALDPER